MNARCADALRACSASSSKSVGSATNSTASCCNCREVGRSRPGAAASIRYWRWHGSPRMYYSDYTEAQLRALAEAIRRPAPRGTRRLVVFDNTAHACATANAARLQQLLSGPRAPPAP